MMPKRLTLEDVQHLAVSKGGLCLAESYVNVREKILWQCDKKHTWLTSTSIVKAGGWCPECASTKLTLQDMQDLAAEKGGRCLSSEYLNSQLKLDWECAEGHTWPATPASVKKGHWCPHCAGNTRYSIADAQAIAHQRGGECLSERYDGTQSKLNWRCAIGHLWAATPASIWNSGTWCPVCAGTMRLSIEQMQALAASRGGKCLSKVYSGTQKSLHWQCAKGHTWWALPGNVKNQGTWCPECKDEETHLTLQDMQALALARGGRCLSESYTRADRKLEWECGLGHRWTASGASIKYCGTWCPACAGVLPHTLDEFQLIAELEQGECLSTEYRDNNQKLRFKCSEGHEWEMNGSTALRGGWCPKCFGRSDYSIEDARQFAGSFGGSCHSTEYRNGRSHLDWSCKEGHQWSLGFGPMRRRKNYCLECAKTLE